MVQHAPMSLVKLLSIAKVATMRHTCRNHAPLLTGRPTNAAPKSQEQHVEYISVSGMHSSQRAWGNEKTLTQLDSN